MDDATHQHHHTGHRGANRKRLAWTLLLAGGYMVAEIVGGLISNSLALLADAAHMLSDVAALGLSLFAVWIAERSATSRRTYGFYRTEILAALINGAALIAISVYIFAEAYRRWQQPPTVMGALMMWIAVGGFFVKDGSIVPSWTSRTFPRSCIVLRNIGKNEAFCNGIIRRLSTTGFRIFGNGLHLYHGPVIAVMPGELRQNVGQCDRV